MAEKPGGKEWDAPFSGVFPRINRPSTSEITLFVYKPKKEEIESIHLKRIKGKIKNRGKSKIIRLQVFPF